MLHLSEGSSLSGSSGEGGLDSGCHLPRSSIDIPRQASSTRGSLVISHPSTVQAQCNFSARMGTLYPEMNCNYMLVHLRIIKWTST